MRTTKAEFAPQTFTVSRELEYFSEAELTTQTGYDKEDWWPGVVAKELIDNALDACEQAGTPPRIAVELRGNSLSVSDNGPGLPAEILQRILDFSTRTSSKAAYVSPTRGAQGNALKVISAIPYVLGGEKAGRVEMESAGVRHTIAVSTDQVLQRPQIDYRQEQIVKNNGTLIRVTVDSASSKPPEPARDFLQNLVRDYSLFNPHAAFSLPVHGKPMVLAATTPEWRKWRPCDPTSAHWYNLERLETLIGCYIAAEHDGGRVRTVREFVSEFRGLSGTAKQTQVSRRACLERAYLHELARNGRFEEDSVAALLEAMQGMSKPVRPELLGVLGREHFERCLRPVGDTFRYTLKKGTDTRGLPFLIETAFAITPDDGVRGLHTGLNYSVPLGNPFHNDSFCIDDQNVVSGLWALLSEQRIKLDRDPVCLAIHLVCPRFRYLDRGKGSISLGGAQDE